MQKKKTNVLLFNANVNEGYSIWLLPVNNDFYFLSYCCSSHALRKRDRGEVTGVICNRHYFFFKVPSEWCCALFGVSLSAFQRWCAALFCSLRLPNDAVVAGMHGLQLRPWWPFCHLWLRLKPLKTPRLTSFSLVTLIICTENVTTGKLVG